MEVVYLNKEQAEKVRGKHGIYSELQPILTDDGNFILPVEVLKDPGHKEVFADLGECKYVNIDIIIEKDEKFPEETTQILSVKSVTADTVDKVTPDWRKDTGGK